MSTIIKLFCAAGVLVLLSGCATSRSYLRLDLPQAQAASADGKAAVIDKVVDQRVFESDPGDPSTPSLKKGSRYALDPEQRKLAIARKRGGFGHALGDVLLENGQTVETIMHDIVADGLRQQGYRVVRSGVAPADAVHINVAIRQFWAWFTPGFWAATIEARLDTLVSFDGPSGHRQATVRGYGRNAIQVERDANWQVAYQRAFDDYLKQFDDAAQNSGL